MVLMESMGRAPPKVVSKNLQKFAKENTIFTDRSMMKDV